ncbi:hypothetical protein GYMLUDRAFT_264847 [Collybiopsis luxurians FD-317 M1]|uniref:C2H2-type domain-containing protein n=1 Tax=Collybiopsis luxurians FD-317 M1 TaxID=944289 RepID=A0A0D0BGY0_9AGAR|nr:hypothetical protein GYMLUDRAFT_264847 [Collybiopsis luxurians FD-317 M1]
MGLPIDLNPNSDSGHPSVQTLLFQGTAENGGVASNNFFSAPWPLPTQSQHQVCGRVNIPASHSLFNLEPGHRLEHPVSFSPSVPQVDPIDNTGIPLSWSALSTHDALQSESHVARAQCADLSEQSWPNVYGVLKSSVDSGVINFDYSDQYLPAVHPSFDDYSVLESRSSPESPTDKNIPPHLPHEAPSKYPQKGRRSVSSAGIVRASRMRRGVDRKSGKTRPSRFFCPMRECIELDVGFTTKHRYDDHLRRHAGVKPFQCTVCWSAYTNVSDLRRHQKNKKCATIVDSLKVTM